MSSMFPIFRQRFIHESAWASEAVPVESGVGCSAQLLVNMAGSGPGRAGGLGLVRPLLLDLDVLPREDGPPSESVLKRQKFAVFEKQCTKVAEGLYVAGEAVARDRSLLAAHAISHVVNCVGALYPEYWAADGISYKTLWLQDHPQEDITCVLYDTFDFIESARKGLDSSSGANGGGGSAAGPCPQQQVQQQQQQSQIPALPQPLPPLLQHQQPDGSGGGCAVAPGGRVLVHCSQGVSRSTSIAIAYLMWKTGGSYEEVYQTVRSLRGVTSPNVGFMCQLINWAKRRSRPPSRLRVYRMAPHCSDAPAYVVAKPVAPRPGAESPDWSCLDERGCFLLQLPRRLLVWRGSRCGGALADAGLRAAGALVRYEGAPPPDVVRQGEEPEELLAALAPSAGCSSSSCSGANSGGMSLEPSAASLPGAGGGAAERESAASAPAGSQQQQQQQPWQHPAGVASCSSGRGQQCQQAHEGDSSAAAAAASALLTGMQLWSGLLGVVGEVAEYSCDYEMLQQALRGSRAGGGEEAGRATPRSFQAADGQASAAAAAGKGGSSSGSSGASGGNTPGRSASPASSEGRCRKHRRSSSERCVLARQAGRMSATSSAAWAGDGASDGGASGGPSPACVSVQGEPTQSRLDPAQEPL